MNRQNKLPFRITLLLWLVLIITAWNMLRVATALAWHDTLEAYASPLGLVYISASGAVWSGLGVFLLVSFFRGAPWTRWAFLIAASAYSAWVWADRLLVQSQLGANWPFSLAATILLLGYTTAIVLDPRNKTYFMKRGV